MESSGSEPAHEFFEAWLNIYEATSGRLVEVPAVGPSREKYDKMATGFSNDEINKESFALRKKTKELASQIDKLSGKGHSTL